MRYTSETARSRVAVAVVYTLLVSSPGLAGVGCPGDCDQDGQVTINELITAVKIALKTAPLSTCPRADRNGDNKVSIAELQKAITATTNDCDFCGADAPCDSADTKTENCGACGTQSFACNDKCRWTKTGTCEGQSGCLPGSVDIQNCSAAGLCPQKTRTCGSDCTWSDFSACAATGVCSPGTTQSCGGNAVKTCNSDCEWGPCVCSGTQTRGCTACPAGDYVSGYDCFNLCPGDYASNICTPACGTLVYACGACPAGYHEIGISNQICNPCSGLGGSWAYECQIN